MKAVPYTYTTPKWDYNPQTRRREKIGMEERTVEAASMFDVNKAIMRRHRLRRRSQHHGDRRQQRERHGHLHVRQRGSDLLGDTDGRRGQLQARREEPTVSFRDEGFLLYGIPHPHRVLRTVSATCVPRHTYKRKFSWITSGLSYTASVS